MAHIKIFPEYNTSPLHMVSSLVGKLCCFPREKAIPPSTKKNTTTPQVYCRPALSSMHVPKYIQLQINPDSTMVNVAQLRSKKDQFSLEMA